MIVECPVHLKLHDSNSIHLSSVEVVVVVVVIVEDNEYNI